MTFIIAKTLILAINIIIYCFSYFNFQKKKNIIIILSQNIFQIPKDFL